MTKKLTKAEIVALYLNAANEQPSAALDAQIIRQAKDDVGHIKPVTVKSKYFYQTWYGILSTAASLVLVVVLLWPHSEHKSDSQTIHSLERPPAPVVSRVTEQAEELVKEKVEQQSAEQFNNQLSGAQQADLAPPEPLLPQEIVSAFKDINALIKAGDSEAAKLKLVELLKQRPALNAFLQPEHQALLKDE